MNATKFNQFAAGLSLTVAALGVTASSCDAPDQFSGQYGSVHYLVSDDGFDRTETVISGFEKDEVTFKNLQLGNCAIKGVTAQVWHQKNTLQDISNYHLDAGSDVVMSADNGSSTYLINKPLTFQNGKQFQEAWGVTGC